MGPKPRVEVAGGFYHVIARGNARDAIFRSEVDYIDFLRVFATIVARFGWRCHAYWLIPNHYHLLLETPEPNLAKGMRLVNGTFAQHFNARYARVGRVFQGPYRAELLRRDPHLLELCRYIAQNPVRARLCAEPSGWPWSSYRAAVGLGERPSFLEVETIHALFGGVAGFRDFVNAERI